MLVFLVTLACASPPAETAAPSPFAAPAPTRPSALTATPAEVWPGLPDWPRGADPEAQITRGSATVEAAIAHADTLVDRPWTWAGRDTETNPGIDCLGLLFVSFGKATGTHWARYPVDASLIVGSGMLGAPVPGLSGVVRGQEDRSLLRRGDVLYFLYAGYDTTDAPLLEKDGVAYETWHTGVYVDEGRQYVLNAHPTYDVVRMPLDAIAWDALYVTRLAAAGDELSEPGG